MGNNICVGQEREEMSFDLLCIKTPKKLINFDSSDLNQGKHFPRPETATKTKKMNNLHSNVVKTLENLPEAPFRPKHFTSKFSSLEVFRYTHSEDTYQGEFVRGFRDGYGLIIYGDGSFYEGYFLDDLRHGFGRFVDISGDCYTGEWISGSEHGFGRKVFFDGRVIEGDFKLGKPYGRGLETFGDGGSYEGEFFDGKKHGFGVFRDGGGEVVYEGFLAENEYSGEG